jgi:cytochrome c biogenesis protein CcmG/thiol:disulfide interchange protein DsbE
MKSPLTVTAAAALLACVLAAADTDAGRAVLQPISSRKSAANFTVRDASGQTVNLNQYRGKVLLLDFWATWCTGCKKEIPWFAAFEQKYGNQGFAVLGVSMDDGGWKVLKPFLAEHKPSYRMALGDAAMARSFGIENLPDTFLIDRQGRIAAAYIATLVDRDNVEGNIRALLAESRK